MIKILPALFFFVFGIIQNLYATENNQEITEQPDNNNIEISEINIREETLIQLTTSYEKDINNYYSKDRDNLSEESDSIIGSIEKYNENYIQNLSIQRLNNTKTTLKASSNYIGTYKSKYSKIIELHEAKLKTLDIEKDFWNTTNNYYSSIKEEQPKALIGRIQNNIDNINKLRKLITEKKNMEFERLNLVLSIEREIELVNSLLNEHENKLKNSYLVQDSEPLWKFTKAKVDSSKQITKTKDIVNENIEGIKLYVNYNFKILFVHIIIIFILLFFFLFNRKTAYNLFESNKLTIFYQRPLISAFAYSFFFSTFLDTHYPIMLIELFLLALIYPIYTCLRPFLKKQNKLYFKLFSLLFAIHLFTNHFSYQYFSGRIILLVMETVIFIFMLWVMRENYERKGLRNVPVIQYGLGFSAVLFFLSIVFNVIGITKLSRLIATATINTIGVVSIVFVFYHATKATLIVLLELKPFSKLNAVIQKKDFLISRLIFIYKLFLIFLFTRSLLNQFQLLDIVSESWTQFISKSWQLGEVYISIGDFLNFFVFVFAAIYISRFFRYILGKEVLIRFNLKRGLPNAIATSVYYTLLIIGLFLAAFSTGIEWSKVNLAIGALGVGIGFGLQNIVYNFIAGLILTYERPVQSGDIIQLSNLMGQIKEIGVRSSRVQTYDGAEVVVPNGNLISNEVINWTLSNNLKRQELKFKTLTDVDPNKIIEILKSKALENPKVLSDPNPLSLFEGYNDEGTLDFRLLFWTHVDVGLSSKSEVALNIYNTLQKEGFEIPVQKRTIVINNPT